MLGQNKAWMIWFPYLKFICQLISVFLIYLITQSQYLEGRLGTLALLWCLEASLPQTSALIRSGLEEWPLKGFPLTSTPSNELVVVLAETNAAVPLTKLFSPSSQNGSWGFRRDERPWRRVRWWEIMESPQARERRTLRPFFPLFHHTLLFHFLPSP